MRLAQISQRYEQIKEYLPSILNIFDSLPYGFAIVNQNMQIQEVNQKFCALIRKDSDTIFNLGLKQVFQIPDIEARVLYIIQHNLHFEDFIYEIDYGLETRFLKLAILAFEGGDARQRGNNALICVTDYTNEERLRLVANKQATRLASVMQSVPDGIFTFDSGGRIDSCNLAAERLFGFIDEELVGSDITHLFVNNGEWAGSKDILFGYTLEKNAGKAYELVYDQGDEGVSTLEIIFNIVHQGPNPLYVAVVRDITQKKNAESKLVALVNYDQLTKLPNRLLYDERLTIGIAKAKRDKKLLGVLFLDLDDFKKVNDTYGHYAGDLLLIEAAQRLTGVVRKTDMVARFGGDEFVFIIGDIDTKTELTKIARKILNVFNIPFSVLNRNIHIYASIGISIFPDNSGDAQRLFKYADIAMYFAKESKRNSYRYFQSKMMLKTAARMAIENRLFHALENNEFVVFYQPQIFVQTNELKGFEALIRWRDPGKGLIPPDKFISVLEETGLIIEVGEWVLRTACQQTMEWHSLTGEQLIISVNVASGQFNEQYFAENVFDILNETGLPPACLEIELTESLLVDNNTITNDNLKKLREHGVRLSIDDFGTGYSSFNYLRVFPVDTLKLDKSFLCNHNNERDCKIAEAIVLMGQGLNIEVIAEGVETREQLDFVRSLGCDVVQGYLVEKPMSPQSINDFISRLKIINNGLLWNAP